MKTSHLILVLLFTACTTNSNVKIEEGVYHVTLKNVNGDPATAGILAASKMQMEFRNGRLTWIATMGSLETEARTWDYQVARDSIFLENESSKEAYPIEISGDAIILHMGSQQAVLRKK